MKKLLSSLLALTCAIGSVAAFSAKANKEEVVQLYSNPSTGYDWRYSADKEGMVEETEHSYDPAATFTGIRIVGAGGQESWKFKGLQEGYVTLTFKYERAWNNEESTNKMRAFTYYIDSNLDMSLVATVSKDVSDNGVVISLPSTPSTGYRWGYSANEDGVLKEVSSEFTSTSNDGVLGASGTQAWRFEAIQEGEVTLQFAYERPFSMDKRGPQVRTLVFSVAPNLNVELVSVK